MPNKKKRKMPITKNCNIFFNEQAGQDWCTHHGRWILACVDCDTAFHATRYDAQYCSDACRQRSYRRYQMELWPEN